MTECRLTIHPRNAYHKSMTTTLDRRDFLRLGAVAGTGLLIGFRLPERGEVATSSAPLLPNAFVQIDPGGDIIITVARSEMGQGVRTALPMIVAKELDADWSRVRVVQADAHPMFFGSMMTVGSTRVSRDAWMPLRRAGAVMRETLVAAAGAQWKVPASELRTENSRVIHDASTRTATYSELAEAAATMLIGGVIKFPTQPKLKDPSQFKLIGTRKPLLDTKAKSTGKAVYGADVRVPGMLFATVVHPPVFGGKLISFDDSASRKIPGVKHVVAVSQGVAIVGTNTWAAREGARVLKITWDNGTFAMSTPEISAELARLADGPLKESYKMGDVDAGLSQAARRVSATYEAPYLAHATMEPMNCTADVRSSGTCEIWAPTQNPQGVQTAAARLTGLRWDKVTVHVTQLGCGWGRRSATDFVTDAVDTSMKVGAPVQVLWTREEDMQHDFYRPAALVRFEGGVDSSGRANVMHARMVAQQPGTTAGVEGQPYAIPNVKVDYANPQIAVPAGYWRSVGPSQNTFFMESFIDELAHAAGKDPVEFRRAMLSENPRLKGVLDLVAEKSGWGTPLAAGRARGVALIEDRGSCVAQVAEVSLESNRVRVHKVTCAADCGLVIHPGIVEAQLSGSIIAGLTAAFYGEITIEKGRVKQSNFNDYQMLRMRETPPIDVYLVPSVGEPGGVGEPALPPIAPAVTNAVFALTGKRIRKLPIKLV
jgi:CO/xanthine dehydrogenase Mo-binding subunit